VEWNLLNEFQGNYFDFFGNRMIGFSLKIFFISFRKREVKIFIIQEEV